MEINLDRRIWIDDRNSIFRRGMVSCISAAGFTVTGESAGLKPFPDISTVDILVFDVDDTGIQRVAGLASDAPARLVGVASVPQEDMLLHAVEAGLAGLLIRSELTPERVVGCLQAVANGAGSLPPHLLTNLVENSVRRNNDGGSRRLADRELDVLRLLAVGGDTKGIANELCYSERTVKNIVHDVLMKMNCRTRAHAVATATRQGFI